MHDWIPWAIGAVAFLYAAVGHAGATGYIAVLALAGTTATAIRPTALALNVVVSLIGTVQFTRAGHQRLALLVPLACASAPCAWLGGGLTLPGGWLEGLLGTVLAMSAARQWHDGRADHEPGDPSLALPRPLRWPGLVAIGASVGLLSGLTGVGGGVFLTPLLLALRVAPLKTVAAVTAPFILVNSLAGLAGGTLADAGRIDFGVIAAAALGGFFGSYAGAYQLPVRSLRRLLALVLGSASVRLIVDCVARLTS